MDLKNSRLECSGFATKTIQMEENGFQVWIEATQQKDYHGLVGVVGNLEKRVLCQMNFLATFLIINGCIFL